MRTQEKTMTVKDRIEALVAGTILVVGLPALIFATQ